MEQDSLLLGNTFCLYNWRNKFLIIKWKKFYSNLNVERVLKHHVGFEW